ncbi:MAG: hypothetical protein WDO18_00855 [Acidobacteriota bacterium]
MTDLEKAAEEGLAFAALPAIAAKPKSYDAWNKTFATWLFRNQSLDIFRSPGLKQTSKPGETEGEFRVRLQHAAREQRDQLKTTLHAKYTPKLETLAQRKMKAQQKQEVEKEQANTQLVNTAITIGTGLLGAFLGRRGSAITGVTQTARAASRAAKERSDIGRAEESVAAIDQQIAGLNAQFEAEVAALDTKIDPTTEVFETVSVRPKKSGITVRLVALGWKA